MSCGSPPTTVQQYDHAAAAAYLMKHVGTAALMVMDARAGQPTGIITVAVIARAIADGKNVNDVWADAVMTTRPATTTGIRDAAEIMTARHFRHLPVADDADLAGVVDIIDVCRALIHAGDGRPQTDDRRPVADPDRAAQPGLCTHDRRLASARLADPSCPETQNDPKLHSPAYRATPTSPAPPNRGSHPQVWHLKTRLNRPARLSPGSFLFHAAKPLAT
jgi:CBS domain-containing protein